MRARKVYEDVQFRRGVDSYKALDVGILNASRTFPDAQSAAVWIADILPSILGMDEIPEDIIHSKGYINPKYVYRIGNHVFNKIEIKGDSSDNWCLELKLVLMSRGYSEKISESAGFQRGTDPKTGMGLGRRQSIDKWMSTLQSDEGPIKYKVNDDYTIDIFGALVIPDHDIRVFPDYIQFGKVHEDFMVDGCGLESLRGCPREVRGFFSCAYNKLHSLEGMPEIVFGDIFIEGNPGAFSLEDVLAHTKKMPGRAIRINESINTLRNFHRGADPKSSLNIGAIRSFVPVKDIEIRMKWIDDPDQLEEYFRREKEERGYIPAVTDIRVEIDPDWEGASDWPDYMALYYMMTMMDGVQGIRYNDILLPFDKNIYESSFTRGAADPKDSLRIGRVGERALHRVLNAMVDRYGGGYTVLPEENTLTGETEFIEGIYLPDGSRDRGNVQFIRYYPDPDGEVDHFTYGNKSNFLISYEKIATTAEEAIYGLIKRGGYYKEDHINELYFHRGEEAKRALRIGENRTEGRILLKKLHDYCSGKNFPGFVSVTPIKEAETGMPQFTAVVNSGETAEFDEEDYTLRLEDDDEVYAYHFYYDIDDGKEQRYRIPTVEFWRIKLGSNHSHQTYQGDN